jgi:hypothetical protein
MKSFVFKRESKNFDDILSDKNINRHICTTISFLDHLILELREGKSVDKVSSYIVLKYGDDLVHFNDIVKDRTPVPYVDYLPDKKLIDGHYV